jgi:hypothetical protein
VLLRDLVDGVQQSPCEPLAAVRFIDHEGGQPALRLRAFEDVNQLVRSNSGYTTVGLRNEYPGIRAHSEAF